MWYVRCLCDVKERQEVVAAEKGKRLFEPPCELVGDNAKSLVFGLCQSGTLSGIAEGVSLTGKALFSARNCCFAPVLPVQRQVCSL